MTTSYQETVSRFETILEVEQDDVLIMLEGGRLTDALISTLKNKGVRPTSCIRNSVESTVNILRTNAVVRKESTLDPLSSKMTITIMSTEVVSSTTTDQRLGDRQQPRAMRAHDE